MQSTIELPLKPTGFPPLKISFTGLHLKTHLAIPLKSSKISAFITTHFTTPKFQISPRLDLFPEFLNFYILKIRQNLHFCLEYNSHTTMHGESHNYIHIYNSNFR
ncbi:hypothetical protein NE237_026623 [Protea cynaroides]|uniref:Uncharacterized protein n=1 Tax=Protea cynaroides TaxID=273540 RepID=A0A9Q0H431_9MAGN|nr:hypothetical protein NE237_026623 [Protea cynaroides]